MLQFVLRKHNTLNIDTLGKQSAWNSVCAFAPKSGLCQNVRFYTEDSIKGRKGRSPGDLTFV